MVCEDDECTTDCNLSFDSSLSLHQNITNWQITHGRMHICQVVYERNDKTSKLLSSSEKESSACSANILNAIEMGADILRTTVGVQEMSEEERSYIRMRQQYQ
jgi:hypothetical protein